MISAYKAVSEIKCSAETMKISSLISPDTIFSVSGACVTGFAFQHIKDFTGISLCVSPIKTLPICRAFITLVLSGTQSGLQITSNL